MGLLTSFFPVKTDPRLGELRYAFGKWTSRDAKIFGESAVPLRLPGDRSGPSPHALRVLKQTEEAFEELKQEIATKLFELYENLADGADLTELSEELGHPFPKLGAASQVWQHVKLKRVWIGAYGKANDIELAWFADWEVEHTAGAVMREGKLVDFSASVGPW